MGEVGKRDRQNAQRVPTAQWIFKFSTSWNQSHEAVISFQQISLIGPRLAPTVPLNPANSSSSGDTGDEMRGFYAFFNRSETSQVNTADTCSLLMSEYQ
jgi:kynureninase